MNYPRVPKGTTAPAGVSRLSVTDTASAAQGNNEGGVYGFRVFGNEVFLLFDHADSIGTPSSSNGLPLVETDGIALFEMPNGWRFKAICSSGESSSLAWWRAGER